MQKFTQKWCIVSFLEATHDGQEFDWKDWPLHVTLAGVFSADWQAHDLLAQLRKIALRQSPLKVTGDTDTHWGADGEYHVTLLEKTSDLQRLHLQIHTLLMQNNAVLNDPAYAAEGFVPHSTMQKHARLHQGETATLTSLSVIDMFPRADGYRRKILHTLPFTKSNNA